MNVIDKLEKCGMVKENCWYFIGLWVVGFDGDCFYKDVGFKVGINGFKKVIFEVFIIEVC